MDKQKNNAFFEALFDGLLTLGNSLYYIYNVRYR